MLSSDEYLRVLLIFKRFIVKTTAIAEKSHTQRFFVAFDIDTQPLDSIIRLHLPDITYPKVLIVKQCGRLAQLGEHRPYKARVTGSSPVASTTFSL